MEYVYLYLYFDCNLFIKLFHKCISQIYSVLNIIIQE